MNDSYGKREGNLILIGTEKIAMKLELTDAGEYFLRSLKNIATGKEYVQTRLVHPDEFAITVNGKEVRGSTGGFSIESVANNTLSQGELETVVTLKREDLLVERHYIAYPGLAVIQSYTTYKNCSDADMIVSRPSLYVVRLLTEERENVDFSYMTGGANFSGSQIFKTVPVKEGFVKEFDSMGEPEIIEVDGHKGNSWHNRMNGCAVWNEFFAMTAKGSNEGMFLTFDYQGWWKAKMSSCDGNIALCGHCELIEDTLPAGETLRIAPNTIGFYVGDYDDLGNTINEYIYQYKWDYTNDRYFNRTSLTIWRAAPLTEKVFKMLQAARYCGFESLHVDDFWFDAKGNWNGIFGDDWNAINKYIAKSDMTFRLWMPPWHADRLSQVWLDHPDWMLDFHGNWYNWTIDMSKEEAYQWILNMLCEKQKEFGTYFLRVDGDPVNLQNNGSFDTEAGSWNCNLKQSENFYRLYKEFKDRNPDAGLNGCSSGGHTLGIESSRYVDDQQITDGWCFHMGGYYTTMILPIDKHQGQLSGAPFSWYNYSDASFNISGAPGALMQDPEIPPTPEALEGKRKEMELFYFLRDQGVYGRWIKIFRPLMEHGDPTFILQRMTWDLSKGMLMIMSDPLNPLLGKSDRIYLKGLDPEKTYLIESRLGSVPATTKTGAEWMAEGLWLENVRPGEVIFINLPDRPGTGSIKELPAAPSGVAAAASEWFGHKGVDLTWTAPENTRYISYYEIAKDGVPFTKVARGTYFFDDGADGKCEYSVRSVDYDGQVSDWVK